MTNGNNKEDSRGFVSKEHLKAPRSYLFIGVHVVPYPRYNHNSENEHHYDPEFARKCGMSPDHFK